MALLISEYPTSLYSGYWETFENEDGTCLVRVYDKDVVVAEKLMKPQEVEGFVRPLLDNTRKE